MKTSIPKKTLIDVITSNRTKHHDVFEKALVNFKTFATKEFEDNLALLRAGKMPKTYITFAVPTDQTRDYDRVIGMLQASVEENVELSEQDYSRYVLDQWDWKKQWVATSNTYGKVVDDDGLGDEDG